MFKSILVFGLITLAPLAAQAGALDSFLADFLGVDPLVAWYVEAVAAVSGLLGLFLALLPTGIAGGAWDKARTVLNYLGSNWGNARNEDN